MQTHALRHVTPEVRIVYFISHVQNMKTIPPPLESIAACYHRRIGNEVTSQSQVELPQMLDVVTPLLHFCHSPPPPTCLCLHLLLCLCLPNPQQSCCYDTAERVNSL
jgi:hypothetical protein